MVLLVSFGLFMFCDNAAIEVFSCCLVWCLCLSRFSAHLQKSGE